MLVWFPGTASKVNFFNKKEKETTRHLRLLESRLSDLFFLKSQKNQLLQVSYQLYQDLKVGSYVRIYSVPLEPFCNSPEAKASVNGTGT